jgi:2-polyprenyl-3-methyl-5-hydroxy-6-metoxy-1,4-benzoquinol methylase
MRREGYRVTADHEATHWWFVSRRDLVREQLRRAARALGFPGRRLRLLDYGCGTGFNLRLLAEFGEVVGADTGQDDLADVWKGTGFPLLDLRADQLAHHGRFDVVTALDVLEHVADDVAGLADMRRFLAPQGQLILTVPAYGWLWGGEDVISEHRRRYTRAALVRACEAAALDVLFVSYWNLSILPAMTAVVWARRLLGSDAVPRSNLSPTPAWLNRLVYAAASREARWVGGEHGRLPAGASLVCRVRGRP